MIGVDQPTITMGAATWALLTARFLDAETADMVQLDSFATTHRSNGWADLADIETGAVLSYKPEEVRDFVASRARWHSRAINPGK